MSETALAESVGKVNVRLTLENPPTVEDGEGYTGCRLRLNSASVATSPQDVTFSNQKKLNPSNDWSAEAKLMTVVDDSLVEGNESLVVEGHCTGSKSGTEPSHEDLASRPLTLTIVDDDEPGAISLSVSPDRLGENGGEQAVTVTAETEDAPDSAVTISLDLGSGSYTVTGTQSIEIAASATSGSTALTFAPSDDGNTSDDTVTIGGSAPGYTVAGTSLTIEEPPAGPPPRILASVGSSTLSESAGLVDVRLTLENPPDTAADDEGYTGCRLRLGAGGDAESPADVTFSNQKKLNAGNGWSAEAGLLSVVDDALVEGDESLVVEGHCTGSKSGTQPSHESLQSVPLTLTIRDNDLPDIGLSVSPDRIGERDGAQAVAVTASTGHAPESALTVNLDLGAGAYDVSGTQRIEIAADATSGSTTLTFTPRIDGNSSDDEVSISGTASGYTVTGTQLTIAEPPAGPPPRVVASVAASTIAESAGSVNVRLTLENPPEVVSDRVGYTGCRLRLGSGGEAAEPADVTFSNQKKLNPGNGWTAEAGLLTVVDDTLVEGNETLVVEGHCTGDTGGPDPSYSELASVPLTLTIEDDDKPAFALSVSPDRIGEDLGAQAVTVTATTQDAPDSALTVSLSLGAGSYSVTGTQAIEIGAGATRGTTTLTFEPSDDSNDTDDGVSINGTASGYTVTPTTLTINEPEVRMTPRIVASTARATMRESVGDVTVRLRLEHPPENAAETDGYTGCRLRPGSGGDAETPSDATFSGQLDLTSSNGWSAQAALLTVVDDTAREDDETLVVEGYCTGSTSGTDPTHSELESVPLTLTIVDNDDPVIRLSVSPINIFEDAGARVVTITAETDEAPDTAVTVTLILGAGSYSTTGLRYIEIESGNTSGSTDLTFEPEHDGNRTDDSVSIDGSATGYFVIPSTLIISDSTTDVPVVVASVENSTLVESTGRVNVRLTLDHPPETEADGGYTGCRLRLGAGGEAETPADVIFSNQKKLSPSNDWSAETQFMRVVDDDTYEGDETLVVEGYCTGTNRGVEPSHTALDFVPLILTIEDNDLPSISLTTNPRRIGEGGGRQAVTVTAWAEKAPEEDGARVYLDLESGSYTVTGSRSIWIDRSERSGSTTLTFEPADDGNTTDDEIVIDGNASGYRVDATQLTIRDSNNETATPTALVPLFLNATDPFRHGFVRVINRSTAEGEVRLTAIDDTGYQPASVSIRLGAAAAVQFNSEDLENGNPEKGLAVGVGQGTGQWRLLFDSELDLGVLAYVRTSDGFLTAVHDVAPLEQGDYRVATFNPGSNVDQVSTLRVVNTSPATASVTVEGYEESGTSSSGVVRFDVPANTVREFTAAELETGAGLASSLGSGTGKWRLAVRSEQSIVVMSLLESPEGYLTNLSSLPALPEGAGGVHPVPFFPAASDPSGRQGFVRLISRSPSIGNVSVRAFDRSDTDYAPLTISLDAWETAHFNSDDLELGNASKGLTGSTGSGTGDWRLELTSALNIDALSYVRTTGGFLTSMHDIVPSVQGVHDVATFNPGSNRLQVSRLLLINPENQDANVTIEGTDDDGASPGGTVAFTVAAGSVRVVDASQLESGGDDLSGAIGDGTGKWRLIVEADRSILVVNLLSNPTGHITNLSSVPK